jgi:hypothetical protein
MGRKRVDSVGRPRLSLNLRTADSGGLTLAGGWRVVTASGPASLCTSATQARTPPSGLAGPAIDIGSGRNGHSRQAF